MTRLRPTAAVLAAAALLATAGCAQRVTTNGNMVEQSRLEEVRIGRSTRADVAEILGTPTAVATFDANVWHYIGQVTEQSVLRGATPRERRVVTISFDDAGVVRSIEERGLQDGNDVTVVARTTPTPGRELTFLQQLLGNVGRFPGAGGGAAGAARPPGR